jgi:serine/threonine-protein kinase RsbW
MALECHPLTLTIPSDLRLLAIARAFVDAACKAAGLDEPTTAAIVLATHEAAGNVIRHAHQDLPHAQLQIQCWLQPDLVEVHILDEGEPFNLESIPDLDPSELRIGGRGVYLMRALMDELSCQPRGERGNTLRMVKRCGAYPRPSEAG